MFVIRENINGKVFGVAEKTRMQEYKKNNEEKDDVDLTIYEVVESKTGTLKLEKLT